VKNEKISDNLRQDFFWLTL